MTIREATAVDAPAILEMATHFIQQSIYGDILFVNREQLTTLIDAVITELGVIYLAEIEQVPLGFIAIVVMPHPMTGARYAEELAWWVEPGARRGRVGVLLWQIAEDWARSQNVAVLKMVAPVGSRVGASLMRHGYTPLETHFVKVF